MSVPTEREASAAALAVESDPDRFHTIFVVFVTIGILLAFGLGVREVLIEPVIELDDVRHSDISEPVPVQAQVLARNTSGDVTYCIEVVITASDRDGLTLASQTVEPTSGDGTLPPGRSANYVAVFSELTQQQIDEELSDFFAFVTAYDPC